MRTAKLRPIPTALACLPLLLGLCPTAAATVAAAHNDMDGDGRSDLVWQHTSTGKIVYWPGGNREEAQPIQVKNFPMSGMLLVGTGHFGFSTPDIEVYVQDRTSGRFYGLYNEYPDPTGTTKYAYPKDIAHHDALEWVLAPSGDFDGDGSSDLLFRNRASGVNLIQWSSMWYEVHRIGTLADTAWNVVGVGDFDGDGRSDILWRHATRGSNMIWHSGRAAESSPLPRVKDAAWRVGGVGDFDGDGQSDIFWRHAGTGRNTIWRSGMNTQARAVPSVRNVSWQVGSVGDFDDDGRADVLWRNQATGVNVLWKSADAQTSPSVARVNISSWRLLH